LAVDVAAGSDTPLGVESFGQSLDGPSQSNQIWILLRFGRLQLQELVPNWSYFKGQLTIAVNIWSSIGSTPMQAFVEYADEIKKMRAIVELPLAILMSYDDSLLHRLYTQIVRITYSMVVAR
jgi:hypothetical protein